MASTCAGGTVCAKRVLKNLRDMVMTRRQLPQEKNTGKVDLMVCHPTSTPEVGAGSPRAQPDGSFFRAEVLARVADQVDRPG